MVVKVTETYNSIVDVFRRKTNAIRFLSRRRTRHDVCYRRIKNENDLFSKKKSSTTSQWRRETCLFTRNRSCWKMCLDVFTTRDIISVVGERTRRSNHNKPAARAALVPCTSLPAVHERRGGIIWIPVRRKFVRVRSHVYVLDIYYVKSSWTPADGPRCRILLCPRILKLRVRL